MMQRTGSSGARTARRRARRTTVAIIEDQQTLAGAIQRSLATIEDLHCVGTAPNLAAGLVLVESTQPDVLVTDFRLTDGDVSSILAELLSRSPDTKVLVFTGWPDERSFREVMATGATGFLDKAAPFEDLLDGIRRVSRGEVVVASRFLPVLTRRAIRPDDELSRRELEVLQLLAEGRTTAEVADELALSVNTVRNHVTRILAKLEVRSRLEAVNVALRRGLIRFDPPAV